MKKINRIKAQSGNYLINIGEDYCYISPDYEVLRVVGVGDWIFADSWNSEKEEINISNKLFDKVIKKIEEINEERNIYWELWNSDYDCLYETFYSYTELQNHLRVKNYGGDERIRFIHPNLKNSWIDEDIDVDCPECGQETRGSYTDSDRDVVDGICSHCGEYFSTTNF